MRPVFQGARGLLAAGLALGLGACDIVPDWMGSPEEPPLPGQRIPVMVLDRSLEADAEIAGDPVRLPPPMATPNWPLSGGFADHAVHHVAAPGPLAVAWKADIGDGGSGDERLTSSPIVAQGVVYVMDASSEVSAVGAQDGRRLWRVDLTPDEDDEGGLGGGLGFGRGRLFATTGYGEVIAMDPASGAVIWRRLVGPPLRAAPTVSRGAVYAVTTDNQLLALDAASGEVLWDHRGVEETAGLIGGASPAVSGGAVVVAYSSGELYALRAENGSMAWTDALIYASRVPTLAALNDINGDPVIDRGRVYAVSQGGRLAALDLRTGQVVWDVEVSGVQTPWIAGDYIYLVSDEGELLCLERADGRVRWVQQLPRWEEPEDKAGPILWVGPILAGDRLILGNSLGEVYAVSPYTGKPLGKIDVGSSVDVPPVAADGSVFILTEDGDLVALR